MSRLDVIPLVANDVDRRRVLLYLNPILNPLTLMRSARTTLSVMRHPVRSLEFPAKQERLVTADELMRYGLLP